MFTLIKTFLGPVWTAIAGAGILATIVGGIWLNGDLHGRHAVKAQWDAAIAKALADEDKARKDAEKEITDNPKEMERDPNNRDR